MSGAGPDSGTIKINNTEIITTDGYASAGRTTSADRTASVGRNASADRTAPARRPASARRTAPADGAGSPDPAPP